MTDGEECGEEEEAKVSAKGKHKRPASSMAAPARRSAHRPVLIKPVKVAKGGRGAKSTQEGKKPGLTLPEDNGAYGVRVPSKGKA